MPKTKIDDYTVRKMYLKEKKSCFEIAVELDTDPANVSYYLRRHGVKMRPVGKPGRPKWKELEYEDI